MHIGRSNVDRRRFLTWKSKITGHYKEYHFTSESEEYYWEGPDGWELSDYLWCEGNYSCDCNRLRYTKITPEMFPELFHIKGQFYGDGSGPVDETHARCGEHIRITKIEPIGKEAVAFGLKPMEIEFDESRIDN